MATPLTRSSRTYVIGVSLVASVIVVATLARFGYHSGVIRRIEVAVDGSTVALVDGMTGRFAAVFAEPPAVGAFVLLHGEPSFTPKGDLVVLAATTVAAIDRGVTAPFMRWPDGVHTLFSAHRLVAFMLGLALLGLNEKAVNATSTLILGAAFTVLFMSTAAWIGHAVRSEPAPSVASVGAILIVAGSFALASRYARFRQALLGRVAVALLTLPLSHEIASTVVPVPLVALIIGACVPLVLPRASIWIVGAWLASVGVGLI